jgi:hypothetical protein
MGGRWNGRVGEESSSRIGREGEEGEEIVIAFKKIEKEVLDERREGVR